jgi:N-alpha-acetyl-L-2,4-diaminobutyrate deacetylase
MAEVTVSHTTAHTIAFGEVDIPYWEVTSGRDGPVLLITATQHGNEVQGPEVIRRFVLIAGQHLQKGQVIAVPFCNRPALWKRRHHISSGPERPYGDDDGHNMNRTWPGRADGNDTERMSYAIYQAVGDRATHCIDIHSWERFGATACLPRRDRPRSMELARVSALPFAMPSAGSGASETKPDAPCQIGAYFNDSGRASLTFELSGQYVVIEKEVRRGLRCCLNIARFLGMLPGEPEGLDEPMVWMDTATVVSVEAPSDGLFVEAGLETCDWVQEGQLLGHILSDADLSTLEVRAPISGRLSAYGCRRDNSDVALPAMHPYASKGDRLATIAAPNRPGVTSS